MVGLLLDERLVTGQLIWPVGQLIWTTSQLILRLTGLSTRGKASYLELLTEDLATMQLVMLHHHPVVLFNCGGMR